MTNLQNQIKSLGEEEENIIVSNLSAWVNGTVLVEGIIEPTVSFPATHPPSFGGCPLWNYPLSSNGTAIGLSWQGSSYNGTNVTVVGVATNGLWRGSTVYFIETKNIQLL